MLSNNIAGFVAIVWPGFKYDDCKFQRGGVQKPKVPLKNKTTINPNWNFQWHSGGGVVQNKASFLRVWYSLKHIRDSFF